MAVEKEYANADLEAGKKADTSMRRVTFSIMERAVLVPVELSFLPKPTLWVLLAVFLLAVLFLAGCGELHRQNLQTKGAVLITVGPFVRQAGVVVLRRPGLDQPGPQGIFLRNGPEYRGEVFIRYRSPYKMGPGLFVPQQHVLFVAFSLCRSKFVILFFN